MHPCEKGTGNSGVDEEGGEMNKALNSALDDIAILHNINRDSLTIMSVMLLLLHYGYAIPDFPNKDIYMKELEKKGKLKKLMFKRRKQERKSEIRKFMRENIMV